MYFKSSGQQQPLSTFKEELSLLQRKDQQIKRLQSELEEERRRADNAVKMLENYKNIQGKYQEGGESLRSEIMRRVKAEEELAKVQQRNAVLEEGIRKYIGELKNKPKLQAKTSEDLESEDHRLILMQP